jgi:ketosteroid isomerase-like protein
MKNLVFCLFLVSCVRPPAPDLEKAKQEILSLEARQRAYHVGKDARSFVDLFSDDFLSISQGEVTRPGRKESYNRFNAYFNRVTFVKWDDVAAPVIRFSDDGSVAYAAVQKMVVVSDSGRLDTTRFAWLTVYRKEAGLWKIDCVVSTNK